MLVTVKGAVTAGGSGALLLDCGPEESASVPFNSRTVVPKGANEALVVKLEIGPHSTVLLTQVTLEPVAADYDLFSEHFQRQPPTSIIVSPLYPSTQSQYAATFTHARSRGYQSSGHRFPVVVVSYRHRRPTTYEIDGVTVFRTNYQGLTELLSRWKFSSVVVHFFDEHLAIAFDRALQLDESHLIFICHGAETLFDDLVRESGPYFAPPRRPDGNDLERSRRRHATLAKYARHPNATWVFVSQWQKLRSEELLGFTFERHEIIHNYVDPGVFVDRERRPEHRHRILISRRWDNERNYALDVSVRTILELSRRPFFGDLEILVLGDGDMWDALAAPLKPFKNVTLRRSFLSQEDLSALYADYGVLLSPIHYDNAGVASSEAAMSAVVVVSNDVGAVTEFRPLSLGTIADACEPAALADIIERLHREPEWYLRVAGESRQHTQKLLTWEATIGRELALIERRPVPRALRTDGRPPLLSIAIPTYNMETMLERCVHSIVRCERAHRLEVLIVDDGSRDRSAEVARALEARYAGIVRVVSKENGGHGSAVNTGLAEARGRYFRVIDSDDYVDWVGLDVQLERLEAETSDVVLTDYTEDWPSYDWLDPQDLYGNLPPWQSLNIDDMVDINYGFRRWGPLLSTSTYRTDVLRRAGMRLDERCAYVDMEYNVLALHEVKTLRYYPVGVYRYSQGRATQTVNREAFIKKHRDHERVIVRIADYIDARLMEGTARHRYALHFVLKPLVVLQYRILLEWICDPKLARDFENKLKRYSFAKEVMRPSAKETSRKAIISMGEIIKNALPHAFVDGIEPAPPVEQVRALKLLKRVARYFVPHIVVKTYKQQT